MAVNTSKNTVGHVYRRFAYLTGEDLAPGVGATNFSLGGFIENFNHLVREYAGETQMLHRLAIILPNHNWLRYIQCTHQQLDKHMIRIDLEGQTVSTLSAEDPDNLDWQYESPCTGEGFDPDYAGKDSDSDEEYLTSGPDSFPKIYLPKECNIPILAYGYYITTGADVEYVLPRGYQAQIGNNNEPLTPCLVDMRLVGYGAVVPGQTGYPSATDYNNYFIDPFMICAMRLLTILPFGGIITNLSMPYSADEYLNTPWSTILGMGATTGVIGLRGVVCTFVIDGVTYTVSITDANYNVTTNNPFVFEITDGLSVWEYSIYPAHTPWQTVGTQTNRWGNLFKSSTLYANRAMYIVVNDWNLRLPDDLWKIKWVWKLSKDTWYYALPEDATDDMVLTHTADNEIAYYDPMDYATHYRPLTEGAFTREKMGQLAGEIGFTMAGYYIQLSQQLRLVPRTIDPVAIYYVAKPDMIPNDLTINELDTRYIELPGIAVEVIIYKLAWEYFASAMGGDLGKARDFQAEYYRAKDEMDKLFKGRMGQDISGTKTRERMPVRASIRHKAFGSYELGEP